MEETLIIIASIFVTCFLCQWIAWRIKLPAIIFLLISGLLAGPILKLCQPGLMPDSLFFPFVSLSVSIILFEGSLTLRFRDILGLQSVVRNMISFGMLVTWLITAVTTRYAIGLSWEVSFLFGAITVVTGPTVIVPILRTVRPVAAVSNILRWEGIIIDPIGATLAVLVYELIISSGGHEAIGHVMVTFGLIVSIGIVTGMLSGYLFGLLLRHHWIPEFLHNIAALSLVFGSFTLSNYLQAESGLITVTAMGIVLISLLFIILAARIDTRRLMELGWAPLIVLFAIQFFARPLNIMVSALGSKLTWPERHMLAWIAPRGIVAAAISALFAIHLQKAGFADAQFLVPLTFSVIIGTVLLQSTTARPIAKWLGVAEPEPRGFLIIGANNVARSIARALTENNHNVLLTDTSESNISLAQAEGFETYTGNPISEHAGRHLDLVGTGKMLALSERENLNIAAAMHYRMELGRHNVFIIQSKPSCESEVRMNTPSHLKDNILFGCKITYDYLDSILSQGGSITTIKLSERSEIDKLTDEEQDNMVLLFALDLKNRLHIQTTTHRIKPEPGWRAICLIKPGNQGTSNLHD